MIAGTLITGLVLTSLFLIFFALERFVPLRSARRALARRLLVNLCISALAVGAAAALVQPSVSASLQFVSERRFGLIYLLDPPAPVQLVIGFVLMDLMFYYWHRANHMIPFLWRFHLVHHIDPDLDVSTSFRFHFGEVALSAGFRVLQITLIGVSPLTFAVYEVVFQANTLFHHSNVRLPVSVERLLNRILVTPRMHGIHHSEIWRENNSNYSVVFSWWDRLHRTLRLNVPQSRIVIGIPAFAAAVYNRLGNALLLPFQHQRSYWQSVDGTNVERDPTDIRIPLGTMEQ
jgi:sterol desaturase/sphingolipid hydroxylase (fatty acid hydroxylase superfamily)